MATDDTEERSLLRASSDESLDDFVEEEIEQRQEMEEQFTRFKELANNSASSTGPSTPTRSNRGGPPDGTGTSKPNVAAALSLTGSRARPTMPRTAAGSSTSSMTRSRGQQPQRQHPTRSRASLSSREATTVARQNSGRSAAAAAPRQQRRPQEKERRSASAPRSRLQTAQQQQMASRSTMSFRIPAGQQQRMPNRSRSFARRRSRSFSPVRRNEGVREDGGSSRGPTKRAASRPKSSGRLGATAARTEAWKSYRHMPQANSRDGPREDLALEDAVMAKARQMSRATMAAGNDDHQYAAPNHHDGSDNHSLRSQSRSVGGSTSSVRSSKSIKETRMKRLNQKVEQRDRELERYGDVSQVVAKGGSTRSYKAQLKAPNYGNPDPPLIRSASSSEATLPTRGSRPARRSTDNVSLAKSDSGRFREDTSSSASFRTAPVPGRQRAPPSAPYRQGSLSDLPVNGKIDKRSAGKSSGHPPASKKSHSRTPSLSGRYQRVAPANGTITERAGQVAAGKYDRENTASHYVNGANNPETEAKGCPSIPFSSLVKTKTKEQLKQRHSENERLTAENTRLRAEISRIENRVSRMEVALTFSTASGDTKMKQMEELFKEQHSALQENNRELTSENEMLKEDMASLEQENDTLQETLRKIEKKFNERKELSNVLEQELNETWAENEENKRLADDMQEERDRTNLKVKNLLLEIEDREHQSLQMSQKLEALDLKEGLTRESRNQEERIRTLELELEKTLQSGMERIRRLESELKEQREEVQRLREDQGSNLSNDAHSKARRDNTKTPVAHSITDDLILGWGPSTDESDAAGTSRDADEPRKLRNVEGNAPERDTRSGLLSVTTDSDDPPYIYEIESNASKDLSSERKTEQNSSTAAIDEGSIKSTEKSRDILRTLLDFDSGLKTPKASPTNQDSSHTDTPDDDERTNIRETSDDDEYLQGSTPHGEPSSEREGKGKAWVSEDTSDLNESEAVDTQGQEDGGIASSTNSGLAVDGIREKVEKDDGARTASMGDETSHSIDKLKLLDSASTFASDLGDSLRSGLDVGNRKKLSNHFEW